MSFIQRYFSFALLLLVVSCSSQMKVNLFAAHIEKEKVDQVSDAMTSTGLNLSVNQVPFPDSVRGNAIVYTPSNNANKQVYQLINLLEELGYNINSVNLVRIENHRFSKNNIGLYLVPDDFVSNKVNIAMDIVNEYGSVLCGNNLMLNQDNSFKIEIDIWQEDKQDYLQQIVLGNWQKNDADNIILNADTWRTELSFKRKFSIEKSTNGNVQKVTLEPLYNVAEQGSYLKKNIEQGNVNCHYSISMAI